MKKLLFILPLIFLYLSMASGININVHYCGGKIKKVSFFNSNNHREKGCCGDKTKSKGCCKDKQASVKIEDNHRNNDNVKIAPLFAQSIFTPIIRLFLKVPSCSIMVYNYYHAPPLLYDTPLYLKHQVFLI